MKEKETVEQTFDNVATNYKTLLDSNIGQYGDVEYYARHKAAFIKKNIDFVPKRMLDFGCGIGRNIASLSTYFPQTQTQGCDISEQSLTIARAENPSIDFFQVEETIKEQANYDVILAAGVFHHIEPEERQKVLSQLKLLLSTNGVIVIFEHNPYNPLTRRAVSTCPFDEGVQLLTVESVRRLAERTDLSVVSTNYCLFVPASLKAIDWIENWLYWLPLGGQHCCILAHPESGTNY